MSNLNLCARDVMESDVIRLEPKMTLRQAWELFSFNRISGAPVLSESEELLGVLSQSDILYHVSLQADNDRPQNNYYIGDVYWDTEGFQTAEEKLEESTVEELMSSSVIRVSADDQISTVAVVMRTNHVHRVIVTEGSKVVGIISALGLLQVLEQH